MIIEEMENIKEKIKKLNIDVVELHCTLSSNYLSSDEIIEARNLLKQVHNEFDLLNKEYISYIDEINEKLDKKKSKYSNNCKYFAAFAIIPCIGLFLAVCLVLKNYNKLLETKISKIELDRFIDEVSPNIKIINDMIIRKELLLQKLTNNSNNSTVNECTKNDCLINLIENLISEDDFSNLNQVDSNTKLEIIKYLQQDLNTNCNDIIFLLKEEKKLHTKKLIKN